MTQPQPAAVIHYGLTLLIKLYNSVSAKQIDERRVTFRMMDGVRPPIAKSPGTYMFLNLPRENFDMEVQVYGFEPKTITVDFSGINEQLPIMEVFMIPLDISTSAFSYFSLEGHLEGIEEIECISINEPICSIKDFNIRKQELQLFNPRNYRLSLVHYGLMDNNGTYYDKIEITEEISRSKLILKNAPEHGCKTNQQLMRIVHGQIQQDGSYLLKVYKSTNADYLVRFVVDNKVYFQRMDFHHPEELSTVEKETATTAEESKEA